MNETKHTPTPGPWRIKDNSPYAMTVFSGDVQICRMDHWGVPESDLTCDPKPQGQTEANARLIAACPDCVEALQFYATGKQDNGALAKAVLAKAVGNA